MSTKLAKLAAMAAICALSAHVADAQTVKPVEFSSEGTPPTPFQVKRAEVSGKPVSVKPGDPLKGYLRLPDGSGPFPAVVLLHGCEGIKPFHDDWAAFLGEKGLCDPSGRQLHHAGPGRSDL